MHYIRNLASHACTVRGQHDIEKVNFYNLYDVEKLKIHKFFV